MIPLINGMGRVLPNDLVDCFFILCRGDSISGHFLLCLLSISLILFIQNLNCSQVILARISQVCSRSFNVRVIHGHYAAEHAIDRRDDVTGKVDKRKAKQGEDHEI